MSRPAVPIPTTQILVHLLISNTSATAFGVGHALLRWGYRS